MHLHNSEYITVRGVPVLVSEVMQFQDKFGGQLFDPSVFEGEQRKNACRNALDELDKRLALERYAKRDPSYLPESIDIGDKNWLYVPVGFDSHGTIIFGKSKNRPFGFIGWFRLKRHFRGSGFGHNYTRNGR